MGGRGTARPSARRQTRRRREPAAKPATARARLARLGPALARVREHPAVRWFVARPTLSAALLLALLVVGFLHEAPIGGGMLSPLAMLYEQVPWQTDVPPGLSDHLNPLLSDVAQAHHPWNAFARDAIRDGVFPAWNPHVLAGVPFFANPQTVLLTPFSVPLWILPLDYAVGLSAALKLWAAGFGTYLLVRELKLGFLPALLAAIAYMLCSFHVVWLTHESLPGVSAMLPWMLWLAERAVRRGSLGAAIGLALATGIAITGGHPGTQLHVLGATAVYAVARVAFLPDLAGAERLRRLALAAGGIAAGILLVAVMFLPELLASRGTLGTVARAEGGQPGSEMPLSAIQSVLFPDWWGRPGSLETAAPVAQADGAVAVAVNYNERTFFAGVVTLLIACVALATPGGWRRKAPFAILGGLALGITLQVPGLHWLVEHLPAFDVVQNQRIHFVFELAVAVLAAFGLHSLLERPREWNGRRLAVAGGALLLGVVALATSGASGGDVGDVLTHFATGADVASEAALKLTSATWFLLFVAAVGVALLLLRRRPQIATAICVGLVLLVAFDMLRFAVGYQPIGPASEIVPGGRPSIAYLQRHADDTRFLGLGTGLTTDWSLMYGLHDVRGYDPPFPTLRYFDLWRTANPTQTNWQSLAVDGLSAEGLRVASVLGAGYVFASPGVPTPGSGESRALRALRRVYTGRDATIFANPLAAPRALVPAQVEVAVDARAARAAVVAEGFDPTATAVVERDAVGADAAALAAAGDGPPGEVTSSGEENAEVRLAARLERRALVALNDAMIDGWTVEVDGEPAEAVHVNTVMRGVVVDAGRHEVVWRYDVPGLKAGLVVSLLSAALLAAGGVLLLMRRRSIGDAR